MPKKLFILFVALIALLPSSPIFASDITPEDRVRNDIVTGAVMAGVNINIATSLVSRLIYLPDVSTLSQKQPEHVLSMGEYVERMLSEFRINKVNKELLKIKDTVSELAKDTGVDPFTVVALWAMETNCGGYMGKHNVLSALYTLILDGYRADYFSRELVNAIKIVSEGHITFDSYLGSWAGATGQVQFMPSSFLSYAVDHSGDGKKDLWSTTEDALASAFNYLKQHGWPSSHPEIIPANGILLETDLVNPVSQKNIQKYLGYAYKGREFYFVSGGHGEIGYFISQHAKIINKWNRSPKFVVAVTLLAEKLRINSASE